jgi:DNA-binding GntR family transcriptional regulator
MIAGKLREGILSGVLKGGQPLRQTEIAGRFRVSRIFVREALRQLEDEGLISFYPHPGMVVSELSYEEAREISEIRVALETMTICKVIPLLSEAEPERAEEVLDTIDREDDLLSR